MPIVDLTDEEILDAHLKAHKALVPEVGTMGNDA